MTIINPTPGSANPRLDQWITISDFTPGIQQKVMTPGVIQPSPGGQGAASITNTYRCISLPQGGLGPLPSRYHSFTKGVIESADHYQSNFFVIPNILPATGGGFAAAAFETTGSPFERDTSKHYVNFFFSHDADNGNNTSTHWLDVYDPTTNTLQNLWANTFGPKLAKYAAAYFCATRCRPTSSTNTGENLFTGLPIIVCSYNSPDLTVKHAYSFPNAIEPLMFGQWVPYDYNVGANNVTPPAGGSPPHTHSYNIPGFLKNTNVFTVESGAHGMCVAHQNRVLFFVEFLEAPPRGGAFPEIEQLRTNEAVTYTIPNDYRQDGVQPWSGSGTVDGAAGTVSGTAYEVIFGQENPVGVGCVYSLSSSDLLIIKHQLGAYLVQGDVNAATVRRLPSVAPTGGTRCIGTPSPVGFVYGVNHGGVYAWMGSDGSELISPQLEEDFWISPNTDQIEMFKGVFATWGDWILVPNNWLFDGNSWWRIEDPSIARWTCWQKNSMNNVLYGMRDFIPGNTATPPLFADAWDKMQPSTSYSWQSHPMGTSVDRLMEFHQAVLVVQGQGQIVLTLTDPTVPFSQEQLTLPPQAADGPVTIRKPIAFTAPTVTLRIQANSLDSSTPAPIVHRVSLGYNESTPVEEAMT